MGATNPKPVSLVTLLAQCSQPPAPPSSSREKVRSSGNCSPANKLPCLSAWLRACAVESGASPGLPAEEHGGFSGASLRLPGAESMRAMGFPRLRICRGFSRRGVWPGVPPLVVERKKEALGVDEVCAGRPREGSSRDWEVLTHGLGGGKRAALYFLGYDSRYGSL